VTGTTIRSFTVGNTSPVDVAVSSLPSVVISSMPNMAISGASSVYINTATTTLVKTGSGILHKIIVSGLGTVASKCEIYDNTSATGTLIGEIDTLTLSGPFTYDVAFTTGLTVKTTGTIAPRITVVYE